MYQPGVWGTDAELMAASALLQTDIYAANGIYRDPKSIVRRVRWSLIRPSNNNAPNTTIYIDKYENKHYKPVKMMIESVTLTFFVTDITNSIVT